MKRLPPLLSYYGSKYTIAPLYPRPRFKQIVEPFAGGASYSLCHADHDVLLVDKYERLIAVWQFLIAASPAEILAIPLLSPEQTTDDLPVCQEARWLVGWWVNSASASPCKRLSRRALYHAETGYPCNWNEACRARIAATVPHIKHWRAVCADYTAIDVSTPATWFVDPPYQVNGTHYKHGSRDIDFAGLEAWCRALPGQVLVCENAGATWLPFEPFLAAASSTNVRKSLEVLWTNDGWRMPQPLSLDFEASGSRFTSAATARASTAASLPSPTRSTSTAGTPACATVTAPEVGWSPTRADSPRSSLPPLTGPRVTLDRRRGALSMRTSRMDDLRLGRWQDVLADVECDALICDPPYGARLHNADGQRADGQRADGQRADGLLPSYSHWTGAEIAEFLASWSPRTRGWIVALACSDLAPIWQDAFFAAGRYGFAPVPCVIKGMSVRLAGDGPSSWAVYACVGRPRRDPFSKWGTLPGAYAATPDRGAGGGGRGKPLDLMRAIVKDYSRPGDLVCDPTAGYGTTGLAALSMGRRFVGAECDPDAHAEGLVRLSRVQPVDLFHERAVQPRLDALMGDS